jgi:hypothetical protein
VGVGVSHTLQSLWSSVRSGRLTRRRKATGETDPIKVIAKLREMKNAM